MSTSMSKATWLLPAGDGRPVWLLTSESNNAGGLVEQVAGAIAGRTSGPRRAPVKVLSTKCGHRCGVSRLLTLTCGDLGTAAHRPHGRRCPSNRSWARTALGRHGGPVGGEAEGERRDVAAAAQAGGC